MGLFIGWLILLTLEAWLIYLVVADPSNWFSIIIALIVGYFLIGFTITLFSPKNKKVETPISPSNPIKDTPPASANNSANVINIKAVGVTVDEAGNYSLNSPRQKYIQQLKSGDQIILKPEPDNKYDRNAICVCNSEGKMLGYLPKNSNVRILEEITKNNVEKVEVKAVVGGYASGKAYGLDISILLKCTAANLPKDNTSKAPPISPTSSSAPRYLGDFDLPDPRDYLDTNLLTPADMDYGNDYDRFGPGDVDSDDARDDLGGYDGFDPGDYGDFDSGDY
mgnify:FL=1